MCTILIFKQVDEIKRYFLQTLKYRVIFTLLILLDFSKAFDRLPMKY